MIDFTNSKELFCDYGGSEKKKKIFYKGEVYLLKFPDPVREKNVSLSYVNNIDSEYLGCKIFKEIGIDVQEVLLGKYIEPMDSKSLWKEKNVVACKDFTDEKTKLIEFSSLSNSITNMDRHFTTDINDIYDVLKSLSSSFQVNISQIKDSFWNMFVVDTLIGNTDRHLSNWGFLLKENNLSFAPVYDCGSSLNPLLSESDIERALEEEPFFKDVAYNIHPIYKYKGEKLTYKQFYQKNIEELNQAVLRIVPKIHLETIFKLIDEMSILSDKKKEYLKKSIQYRKENILDVAYKKSL